MRNRKLFFGLFGIFLFAGAYQAHASLTVGANSISGDGALTLQPASGSNLNVSLATTGDLAVNTNQLYVDTSSGFVGVGTATPTTGKLEVRRTSTDTSGNITTLDVQQTVNPSSNSTAVARGVYNSLTIPDGNSSSASYLIGVDNYLEHNGTGTVSTMTGIYNFALNAESANITTFRGTESLVESDGGAVGTITSLHAWAGLYGGSATTMTGLRIDDLVQMFGTVTNRYGIYIGAYTGSATNDYAIYSAATQKSYLAGNLGLGLTTNQTGSKLEVKDGHYASSQTTAPTGTTGTCTSDSVSGTDTRGVITGTCNNQTLIVAFNIAYASAPVCVVSPTNAAAAAGARESYTTSTANLTITVPGNIAAGTWSYICMQ